MIRVTCFGQFSDRYKTDLIARIERLIPFIWRDISVKKIPSNRPSRLLLEEQKFLDQNDSFWILDAAGKSLTSQAFYEFCFAQSMDRHFVMGPAFGFHRDFFEKSLGSLSLSTLTFTHGLAQIMLAETVYRAACQLKNHPFVK